MARSRSKGGNAEISIEQASEKRQVVWKQVCNEETDGGLSKRGIKVEGEKQVKTKQGGL